jgi:NAD(P)-dependent dehydrogenase (short-subunit alcohol dehydrogenase family)
MTQRFDLRGRTALVTGAAGLLGRQHVMALHECGARVVVSDISKDSAEQAIAALELGSDGGELVARALDVTDLNSITGLEAELRRDGWTVDILVNNAAIDAKVTAAPGLTNATRFEAFSTDQWRVEIEVGLTGAMLCSQVFGGAMAVAGAGVILNIASDLGVIAPDQRLYRRDDVAAEREQPVKPVTYSVIKHGLIGLTKYLATYWAEKGVRVNALSPGGVFNGQSDVFVSRLERLIPMGRMAKADEYRGAVQFLCSDASRYMTGQNMVIDGGRTVW